MIPKERVINEKSKIKLGEKNICIEKISKSEKLHKISKDDMNRKIKDFL